MSVKQKIRVIVEKGESDANAMGAAEALASIFGMGVEVEIDGKVHEIKMSEIDSEGRQKLSE